ncbi:MAG TPA: thymidine phosphorylase [Candidatus Bathyarchaeia archaeon]|nr:thymidine phosphorylase [Candidatus Bathyarchaeia archaeon]
MSNHKHELPANILDILRKKRNGEELSREEIEHLVRGHTHGEIADHQAAAWLMAAHVRGLSRAETAHLTSAMLHSGEQIDLTFLSAKKVDKHSTGGVGDKTSLILAPLVAAGGLVAPMISGRGLGHTGGTLDKLEAIPGFRVNLSVSEFKRVLAECGCCITGQTAEIAPADRKLYYLRHFTSTIDSPPLICASIMSKKLAEGIDALVLDVKTGSGAFMKREEDAVLLGELMVDTAKRTVVRAVALVTGMDQPLGYKIGNALEVEEVIGALHGQGPSDLVELTVTLAGWMFHLGGRCATVEEGEHLARELLASGAAREKFRRMIELQGGDARVVDEPDRLPRAKSAAEVVSASNGYVTAMDCELIGVAGVLLGGGRQQESDAVDPAVGIVMQKKLGDPVQRGEALCTAHFNSAEQMEAARLIIERNIQVEAIAPTVRAPLVRRIIRDR